MSASTRPTHFELFVPRSGPLTGATIDQAGIRAGYELRYGSLRLTLNGTRLGGYTLSNLYLSTESLAKGLELSLACDNLFDKHYAQPASAPTGKIRWSRTAAASALKSITF